MTAKIVTKEWQTVELGSLCDGIVGGGTPTTKNKDYWAGEIPWITSKWLGEKMYLRDGEKNISEDAIKHSATHLIPENSLIFATRVGVGKVGINSIPLAINQDLAGLIISESTDVLFLAYQLTTDRVQKYITALKRGATIQGITREDLKQILIHAPALNEQRAIARVLTTVQDAITEQENLIAKLKEVKRSMMHHLFTHGIKGEKTKMTEIGEIPESWEEMEIGAFGRIVTGSTPSTVVEEYYSPSEIDFISPGDIGYGKYIYYSEKQISKAGFEVSRPIPKDAVCCVCIGSSIGKVAKAYRDSTTNQQINTIVCSDGFDSEFIYYLLSFYSDTWRGHATFGPVPMLSKGAFSKIKIPACTDTNEQNKIASALAAVDDKIESLEEKMQTYKNLLKTLLHELMSGERRVSTKL